MSHDANHGDEKRESHERFWLPLVMPAAIFLFAVLTIYGLSRIYLELNDWQVGDVTMATPLAIVISIAILAVCALLASRPVPSAVIGMIAVVAAAGLTGGAIWAAVHEEEPSEPHVVSPTPGDGPGAGISVHLIDSPDFLVTLDPSTAPAGPVPFNIENEGSTLHNFRLVQTDLAPEDLPYNEDDFIVDESQLEIIASTDELATGEQETVTTELAEGSYVVFCNVAAHYDSGMHAAFTVGSPAGGGPPGDEGSPP